MRLIPKVLSRVSNAIYKGLSGELVTMPTEGLAVHDGINLGGLVLLPDNEFTGSGRDNFIRNPDFRSAQNGPSHIGNSAAFTYVNDGWYVLHNGGSTSNIDQITDYDAGTKTQTHLGITTMTGGLASSYSVFAQLFHNPMRFQGRRMALSFKIKPTEAVSITTEFLLEFADVGTPDANTMIGRHTLKANEWNTVEAVFDVPVVGGSAVVDNATDKARFQFWLEAGDDWNTRTGGILPFDGNFRLGNVDLKIGNRVTEHNASDISFEDKKIYEYFEKVTKVMFMCSIGTSAHKSDCTLTVPFEGAKWKPTYVTTLVDSFVSANAVFSSKRSSMTLLGVATDASSAARITEYTINAEFTP